MEIILLERVEKLGYIGDVVTVANGYGRNYLIPKKKGMRATKENIALFEQKKDDLLKHSADERQRAEALAAKLQGLTITLIRQAGESGLLYGSVSARDIAAAVSERGFSVKRQQVSIPTPIKTVGLHPIHILLHPEVLAQIAVAVALSEEEAAAHAEAASLLEIPPVESATADVDA
jgi:large subunit ribosomal protein L9